jgi:predicted SnoaL-like aldol condensation-catalyzing enzyme
MAYRYDIAMKNKLILALLFAGVPVFSQSADPGQANKKLVLDFFRVVFEAQNADAAKDYLSEDYVQHNPLVVTGRSGFINYFKPKWKSPKPVQPDLKEPPDQVVAEGDLVVLMWKEKKPEPKDRSKTYDAFWFDMFRVKDGKLVEHWDNATKK